MSAKTLFDFLDDLDSCDRTTQSLVTVLEMQILDLGSTSTLEINDPHHPVQQLHALCVAIQHQLQSLEKIATSIRDIPPQKIG